MSQWFRIFGGNEAEPAPAAVLEWLRGQEVEVRGSFRGDDQGWFQAELNYDADAVPLRLERYLTKQDDIRNELNSWAAWLESVGDSPTHQRLMQHIIGAPQLMTLHQLLEDVEDSPDDPLVEKLCVGLCQLLARATDGIYQVDHHGLFASDGTLLVPEL
jgi:hypothetical protein